MTLWKILTDGIRRATPEQRARICARIAVTLDADDPFGFRRTNREDQRDYDEDREFGGH